MATPHLNITSPSFKPIVFYELIGHKDSTELFSINTYKTHLALGYKGIPFKVVPLTLAEVPQTISEVFKSTSKVLGLSSGVVATVPVIHDLNTDTVVQDSWRIAEYLEDTYPQKPILHNQPYLQLFVHDLITRELCLNELPLILSGVLNKFDQPSAEYFRAKREKAFGKKLEEIVATTTEEQAVCISKLRQLIIPYRESIKKSGGYLGDKNNAGHADFYLAGALNLANYAKPGLFREIFVALEDGTEDDTLEQYLARLQRFIQAPWK
ncbi:hypothetical protein K493DRAFT_321732 [Basidiobolus meristosporus CBS 931.73]|uniref:GST N-terminal domain-containing protein n=1 Tax=Basidiobolus meristosporus CBS 931.73 TaxID=1314790 RepID=A0A1Y1WQ28_9FUNG|nr:hypothetical protein K493DRAFT_321732 [Basidiobolus meristosporus CBS 931.73]|eukprot:ORX75224.1 hypothetical protein K493DRAFT_321732 [Basidiobolus meristosporus CBS 931.73]